MGMIHFSSLSERESISSPLLSKDDYIYWIALDIGHFSCGNRKCNERDGLRSWEVNFAYVEEGEKKNALVKLRKSSEYVSVFLDGTFVTLKTDNIIINSIIMYGWHTNLSKYTQSDNLCKLIFYPIFMLFTITFQLGLFSILSISF